MNSNWNEKYKWCFGPLYTGDRVGVNNAGIGIFKKQPYKGLAKEILQNVIDAKDPDIKEPAKAVFEIIRINRNEIPGADELSDVIKRCYEYYHDGDDGIKMGILKKAAEDFLDRNGTVPVLKISDYNTIGLTGVKEEKGSNWTGLVREISATNKGNGLSGSFGVGKFAPFNFSAIRTIIYSTLNKDGETALQGKTILTTFKDEKNQRRQNVGLFGIDEVEDCKAIYDLNDVPETFRRGECGTDLFVLGFKEEDGWMKQVAASVLEYFFYTIHKGNLEVLIVDGEKEISIRQDNLGELIETYKEYCESHRIDFSAHLFWEILNDTSGRTKHFKENFKKKGEVELYLLLDPDLSERRILEMRTAGMKIQEDTSFRIGAYFRGIFIATGNGSKSDDPKDNINSFLRKCENQAHDAWSKDEYEDNKEEADKIIRGIHSWILNKIKGEMPAVEEDETEAYGLNDLLPRQDSSGADDQEEKAYSSFEPLPVDIAPANIKPNKKRASDVSVVPEDTKDKSAEEIVMPSEDDIYPNGEGSGKSESSQYSYQEPLQGADSTNNGQNEMPAVSKEKETNKGKYTLKYIHISNVKTPYDSSKSEFRVSFVPVESAENIYIKIRIGADDEDKRNAEIISAQWFGNELMINRGYIVLNHMDKGKKVILTVKLHNARRCPLEVTAYAK
jgi:hypothetical protein